MENYTIDFLTTEWIRNGIISFIFLSFILIIGKWNNYNRNIIIAKAISIILIILTITNHIDFILRDKWLIQEHLPLHLCSLSQLVACVIVFIPKKNYFFEFLFYCGIVGGLQAILTPQINYYDDSIYEYLEYYISHLAIIAMPLFLYFNLNLKLRKFSWLKIFFTLNLLMIVIMPLNFAIKSNYMYLNIPPEVDNPLIIGEWPYYLIYLEFIVIIVFYLTYCLFKEKKESHV